MVAGQLEVKTCLSHPVATDLPGAKSEPAGANICDNATAWTGLMRALVSFILQRIAHQHAQNVACGLFAAASPFRLTDWFHTNLFLFI